MDTFAEVYICGDGEDQIYLWWQQVPKKKSHEVMLEPQSSENQGLREFSLIFIFEENGQVLLNICKGC